MSTITVGNRKSASTIITDDVTADARTLLPGDDASLANTRLEDWLANSAAQQTRALSMKGR